MLIRFVLILFAVCRNCIYCSIDVRNCKIQESLYIFSFNKLHLIFKFSSIVTTNLSADPITRTITFLTKEINVPNGVSVSIVCEIQEILNNRGTSMLEFGQQLTNCVETKSQFEKCLNISNEFEVTYKFNIFFYLMLKIHSLWLGKQTKLRQFLEKFEWSHFRRRSFCRQPGFWNL